jgi:PAS domain S-box-containing protein
MTDKELIDENTALRRQLDEAEATLSAIRNGEVDALVVEGNKIYTLQGADHPYRILVEAMQQGAVTLSQDGSVIYCNDGFAQMVHIAAEKIIGIPIGQLFLASDRELLQRRLAEGGEAKQAELTLQDRDGAQLPVVVTFNLLPLEQHNAMCLVITDMTEHKQNQQLQDSDRRKDEFLAMLAHELRNPLAPIANAAHLLCLSNQGCDETIKWSCEIIDRQVKQLTRIVDDLLDVSRITRGKINLHKAPIEVTAILNAAVETSRPLIESRRHRLHIELPAQKLRVDADLTRMAQVLTNLLNNAAKYTEEGGQIWLTLQQDQHHAVITVRDNGSGISPDLQPSVFELFTQADRTIDRAQGGLGIGLTLVHRLVEYHRGSVSVFSRGIGQGSTFTVRLPLIETPAPRPATVHPASNGHAPLTARRILVVDDNLDAARTMAMMLRAMGHEAAIAHDGPGAIETSTKFEPNLVLLDIGLPGMDGYEIVEHLRTMPGGDRLKIAALTGYGEEQDRKRSREAGFDHHFVKPLALPTLQALLGTLAH